MHRTLESAPLPDAVSVIAELEFSGSWDPGAVSRLIRSKCDSGEARVFLFLGKRETVLLREYLVEVFGTDSTATLRDTSYLGFEVVEINCESFVFAGGPRRTAAVKDHTFRRPGETDASPAFRF